MVTNSTKVVKDTNFKLGTQPPRQSPDLNHEKIPEKGAWPGSHEAALGGDMYSNERLLVNYSKAT